jgi:hypothetical protein
MDDIDAVSGLLYMIMNLINIYISASMKTVKSTYFEPNSDGRYRRSLGAVVHYHEPNKYLSMDILA